ncbi:unnamed protein product [Clonostachys solani]|uniref:Uncharacterized protein n=1 Tax=Clonostachys solani TaxID=160281 RepID=A0A9N9Z3T3_9HYPO|nr:unnamed protein product [Clonostachys solani]
MDSNRFIQYQPQVGVRELDLSACHHPNSIAHKINSVPVVKGSTVGSRVVLQHFSKSPKNSRRLLVAQEIQDILNLFGRNRQTALAAVRHGVVLVFPFLPNALA